VTKETEKETKGNTRMVRITIAIAGLFVLGLVYILLDLAITKKSQPGYLINCDIQNTSCSQKLAGSTVILDIQPKPVRVMENLTFIVKINGPALLKKPHIDLSMPGMEMGLNWVYLDTHSSGVYEGTGTIVKCPTGQTIWRATVTLPEKGTVDFVFDVVD